MPDPTISETATVRGASDEVTSHWLELELRRLLAPLAAARCAARPGAGRKLVTKA